MTMGHRIRWGIAGTAKIARNLFLPSLREADGEPAAVAGRDEARAAQWAAGNGIGRAITGYQDLADDPGPDALHIPLPHAPDGGGGNPGPGSGRPGLVREPCSRAANRSDGRLGRAR